MTTQSWAAVQDHSSDAAFRAWGADFSAKLAAIGLIQTSDTGQINWATVTRPGVNTAAGYEIWRFNDSLQGTSPIFLKIEYGTNTNVAGAGTWITAGTATNGAGTLTGSSVSTRTYCGSGGAATSTVTSYPSYFCCVAGFVGCAFKVGQQGSNFGPGSFAVVRFSDDDGTPNGNGFTVFYGNGSGVSTSLVNATMQVVRTQATAFVSAQSSILYCATWPMGVTGASLTNSGDAQVVPVWVATKQFQQLFAIGAYLNSEISQGSTFSTVMKGSSARNFIALGTGLGSGGNSPGTDPRLVMVWE